RPPQRAGVVLPLHLQLRHPDPGHVQLPARRALPDVPQGRHVDAGHPVLQLGGALVPPAARRQGAHAEPGHPGRDGPLRRLPAEALLQRRHNGAADDARQHVRQRRRR
ncbi:hypothetical protein ACHAPS_009358, partial [Verticillium nonalfalfae]